MKNKIRNRVVSLLLTIVILVISCVTPFFTSSAFVVTTSSALAVAALSALISSLAAGIANGSAQELTSQLINDMTNYVDETTDNFNDFVASFFDGYELNNKSIDFASDLAQFVDVDSGVANISYGDYESFRQKFADTFASSELTDVAIGNYSFHPLGGNLSTQLVTAATLYSFQGTAKKCFYYIIDDSLYIISVDNGNSFFYMSSGNSTGNYNSQAFKRSDNSTISFYSNAPLQLTFSNNTMSYTYVGYFSETAAQGYTKLWSWSNDGIVSLDTSAISRATQFGFVTGLVAAGSDFKIKDNRAIFEAFDGTAFTPSDTDFTKNDIENTVITGQGVGVVSENPTLTFVPTDTATGAADVAIDGKPISEVDAAIEDVAANGDFDVETPSFIIDKFPFCIPFDIYKLFNILSAEPQAPHFQIPITIVDGEPVNIDIDLSEWDWIAEIVRWFMWIIFVVGLLALTNKLIGRG